MNKHRIIYYYQTFNGLDNILYINTPITHIHLSSIHFGNNNDNSPYIHLNDYEPDNKIFDNVWNQMEVSVNLGIEIILMVGGAGGAYQNLFSNFSIYYSLLKKLIKDHKCIHGIDLDVEETVDIEDIKMLINKIKEDFGNDFSISMAPVQSSLQYNNPGLGGFSYKQLYDSPEGKMIEYFNTQFYYDYSFTAFKQIIENGYPQEKIVIGSISSQDINSYKNELIKINTEYPNLGGVFNWEYFDAPKEWHDIMNEILNNIKMDSVFYENDDTSNYIPKNNLYYSSNSETYLEDMLNDASEKSLNYDGDCEGDGDNDCDGVDGDGDGDNDCGDGDNDCGDGDRDDDSDGGDCEPNSEKLDLSYLNTGDLLLFSENYGVIPTVIRWYTNSIWTHVGIVLKNPTYISSELKGYYLLESGFNDFTNIDGEYYYGVQIVDLKQKINSYTGKVCYRKINRNIKSEILESTINTIYNSVKNKPYDLSIYDFLCLKVNIQKSIHYTNSFLDYINNILFNHKKTDRFICSSLVAFIYVELGLLPDTINWSECEPATFSTDNKNDYKLINFLGEQVYIKI